ncbi:MAG: sulfurtransferase [Burkholderiaceae bacterium]
MSFPTLGIRMNTPLISACDLHAMMAQNAPLLVFDCTFDLVQPEAGRQQYLEAHIPAAVHADLNRDLSAKGASDAASEGRHPLPSREQFARWLGRMGLANGMQAVVYDRNGCNFCGRLWWMLRWCGHDAVAVLDGGLAAWLAAGFSLQNGPEIPKNESNYTLAKVSIAPVATEVIATNLGSSSQTLIDARAPARYRGEVEPLDPVAGHIPGALNRPFMHNFQADGSFKPAAMLRAEFLALLAGRDPASVIHHCGSGVSALPNLLAMELAGFGTTALYAGSWSAWCSDASRPVARG